MNKIVFSDLDGTLLDHVSYSYQDSLAGIAMLKKQHIPLIMVSSKTFAEMKELALELGLSDPFIFENGGGMAFPVADGFSTELLGISSEKLEEMFPLVRALIRQPVKAFSEMDAAEVAQRTGLPLQRAQLAKQRLSSLPFLLLGENDLSLREIEQLNEKLADNGVALTKGGRFYHFISSATSKGNAIMHVISWFKRYEKDGTFITMGIGDSLNDLPMLEIVDYPYLVTKHDNTVLEAGRNIHVMREIGPLGFTAAVKDFLGRLGAA